MHAGAGDLPGLLEDLTSGRLTGTPARQYVVLLQEAVQDGPGEVLVATRGSGLSAFFAPVRRIAAGTSGNAIVSTLPLLEPHAVALPVERQPRSAIVTAIDLAGVRLPVVCLHLENRHTWLRGGVFADRGRGRQAAALLAQIPREGPAIAGGDFNSLFGPNEAAVRLFAERFRTRPTAARPPKPTFHDRLTLDHLFFELPQGWEARSWVSPRAYGSDHHPVIAVILGG
jgi:endonuclease/exonuclease/phosphatase family metal-dependent hydrolase